MLSDLRYAIRMLLKSPGFSAVAVLTLALAIGVNSAVFALFDAVLFRPAVQLRAEELVNLFNGRQGATRDFRLFSHDEYLALRQAKETFADVAATSITSAGIDGENGVRKAQAFFTSENYFVMLGVQPAVGRFYSAEEARPGANVPVVVASHALWQRQGGRPDFVGSMLRVNGKPYTVIGVTPEGFNGLLVLTRTDLWVPLGLFGEFTAGAQSNLTAPNTYRLNLTARLAPEITRAALPSRLPLLAERLNSIQAEPGEGARELHAEAPSRSRTGSQPTGGESALPAAIGVFSMSGCVLLIACLNLANMLLARGAGRAREIAVRQALGADQWRIIRQLVIEGLLLACTGGAVGLLLAFWGNRLLVQFLRTLLSTAGESLVLNAPLDARAIVVTFLLCLAATLLFSLGPAFKTAKADLAGHLKQQATGLSAPGTLHRFFSLSHCLVMGQIALSVMLLFAAGLFVRGAMAASNLTPGFDPAGTVVADLDYTLVNRSPNEARRSLFSTIETLGQQPGVRFAAAANFVPYSTRSNGNSVRSAAAIDPTQRFTATVTAITTAYFDAAGIRLLRGRDFTPAEARDPEARVAIIDESLARKLFPDQDPLGRQIQVGPAQREIIGVCAPHRQSNRRPDLPNRVFIPYAAGHDGRVFLVIRHAATDGSAITAAVGPLHTTLRKLDPELPVIHAAPLSSFVENDQTVWLARLGAALFSFFGAIALLLAVVGVYGVKAYSVSRRTREIGIRMAIGAQRHDVFALLLKQGALQIITGIVAGVLMALGAGRILAAMLYQVSPTDPLALIVSSILLGTTGLLACWIPARRAARVDPMVALRSE